MYDNRVFAVESIEKEEPASSVLAASSFEEADRYLTDPSEISVAELYELVKRKYPEYLPKKNGALQVDVQAMLESLPESATVYVRKNEPNPVGATNNLRGLAAKIEFIGDNVAQNKPGVKQGFSAEDTTIEQKLRVAECITLCYSYYA